MNKPPNYYSYQCPYCMQTVYSVPALGQRYSISSANPIRIKKVEKKLSTPYVQADLQIPVVEGSIDAGIKSFMNRSFENDIMEFYNQLNEAGRQSRREAPFVISNIYRVTYNKNNLLSLSILYNEYDQRNHAYIKAPYNYDIITGKALGLRDIFKPGIDYVQLINQEIRKQPGMEGFSGIAADQPYYMEDNHLVVFLKFNAIAPTEDKLPVTKIPLSILRDKIRPEYLDWLPKEV